MRPRTVRRALPTVVSALILLAGSPASAQDLRVELGEAARAFARAWQDGRVDVLASRLGEDGIRLQLPDGTHPALSVKLARAALEDLHRGVGVGPVEIRQVRLLGGDPARGFAEMSWAPHPSGMSESMTFTVFTGLEWRDAAWWVMEVRVLPRDGGEPRTAGDVENPPA